MGAAASSVSSAASTVGTAATAAVNRTQKVASSVSRKISLNAAKSHTKKLVSNLSHVEPATKEVDVKEPDESDAVALNGDPMGTTVISAYEGDSWDPALEGQQPDLDNPGAPVENLSESLSPLNSHRESDNHEAENDMFKERSDLGEPQRYLITLMDVENLAVDSGKIYFRLSSGKRGQESKKLAVGDQLVRGIIKEWTGKLKGINEEFYFEFADPDTWIQIEMRRTKGKNSGIDELLGDAKLHAKVLTTTPTENLLPLSNKAGNLRVKAMKVGRTEELKTEGDEQAVMKAFQKHALQLDTMMHLRCRVIQALDVPAMDDTGTSDPYVVLTCGTTKKRTKVEMKTLTPKWHEDFDFFFPPGTSVPEVRGLCVQSNPPP